MKRLANAIKLVKTEPFSIAVVQVEDGSIPYSCHLCQLALGNPQLAKFAGESNLNHRNHAPFVSILRILSLCVMKLENLFKRVEKYNEMRKNWRSTGTKKEPILHE